MLGRTEQQDRRAYSLLYEAAWGGLLYAAGG